ncbi:MAG: hypothetical protein JWM17_2499, partial [Actinobacteria bacterium]|nr:hypothetical protein [Actinomycetota bacterium]
MTDIQKPDIRGEAETLKAPGGPGGAPATSNGNGAAAPPAATVPAPLPEGEGPHGQAVVVAEPIPPIRRLPPYAERDRRTRREMIVTTLIAVIGVGVLIATALYVF